MEVEKKNPMTDAEIEASIRRVKMNFAIEGMELSEEAIALGRKRMKDEITTDEAMRILIGNYGDKNTQTTKSLK